MRILLSNDDGIDAPGLRALAAALAPVAELFIVAPATEQSAVGHAITMRDPLKVRKWHRDDEFFGYAVSGTPADCVKIALCTLMKRPPDLVVSGINQGANLGTDIIYSGTVSAATEGTLLGVPSIAVSVNCYERTARFDTAARVAATLAADVPGMKMPRGTLLNVNVPNVAYEELKGWRLTSQGRSKFVENYIRRIDPRGTPYYWIGGKFVETDEPAHADYLAVKHGFVSITPLHFDVTDYSFLHASKARLERMFNRAPRTRRR
ncbi:5'/3'-nucleotidase SurE [bacterium]|nr:5'/3'-nucleotidase SurE [bacterium]